MNEKTLTKSDFFKNVEFQADLDSNSEKNYCSCGFPQNLLVPKGSDNHGGQPYKLLVMISDFSKDKVRHSNRKKRSKLPFRANNRIVASFALVLKLVYRNADSTNKNSC